MEQLTKKTHTTPRSLTYTYYTNISSKNASRPTLLLCHGWPDSAALWAPLISALIPMNYNIIAPDLLGYGGTSRPTDASAYNSEDMCADLASILSAENVSKIVVIGHDWGTLFPARFPMYHRDLVAGCIVLNGSLPIPERFDLDETNAAMEKIFGKPLFAYWKLFTAPDAATLLEKRVSSLWDCIHAKDAVGVGEYFIVENGLRKWLENDTHGPTASYATSKEKAEFVARMQRDGFTGPLNWYHAMASNEHWYKHDERIDAKLYEFDFPVLFVTCSRDAVCRPQLIQPYKDAGYLPDLTEKEIDSGHWVTMEKPKELEQVVTSWLRDRF